MIEKLTVSSVVLFFVGWLLVTQSLVSAGAKPSVAWFCSFGLLAVLAAIIVATIAMRLERSERLEQERQSQGKEGGA